jgi:3D (Asp-Asp-Asp) domain-containing protein
MKTDLLGCCGVLLAGLALSSCSSLELSKEDDALQPGVEYQVRRALPVESKGVPKDMPTRYFTIEPASHETALSEVGNFDESSQRTVRTTAYCHAEGDHVRYGSYAAAGAPLRFGMVCSAAADWSRYPLGTRFRIKSQPEVIYEVDDYGSALVGSGTIDLYRPTMGSMNAWGVRNVDIEILQWGSFQDSLRMMRDRVGYAHVRHMMLDIQHRLDPAHAAAAPVLPLRTSTPVTTAAETPAPAAPAVPSLPSVLTSGPPLAAADSNTVAL